MPLINQITLKELPFNERSRNTIEFSTRELIELPFKKQQYIKRRIIRKSWFQDICFIKNTREVRKLKKGTPDSEWKLAKRRLVKNFFKKSKFTKYLLKKSCSINFNDNTGIFTNVLLEYNGYDDI